VTATRQPVGRAVAEALEVEGVSTVFGIPGGHVLPVYDAVYARTPAGTRRAGSRLRSAMSSTPAPGSATWTPSVRSAA
jgi:glyoxylate carboligase